MSAVHPGTVCVLALACGLGVALARADEAPPDPRSVPLRLPLVAAPPLLDGRLDDAAWQGALVLNGFVQTSPGDNVPASETTEVRLCRDKDALYVAFRAHDRPGHVRATVARRDEVEADDYVGLYLDTFADQRKAYVFLFNPLGIQSDGVLTVAKGLDLSVDVVLRSSGVVDADGYVVEAAIPFKSLRCALGKEALWGVHFVRSIKRLDEQDSWMPVRRDVAGLLNQAGHVTGFEGAAGHRTLELIPSLTVSQDSERVASDGGGAEDPGRLAVRPARADPGVTLKYTLSSGAAASLTVNPDFAQVEADQPVVTGNQRFPIFYTEKRPFFLEGIDVFQTPLNLVHTRTVVAPDVAANLTGKRERLSFGLLLASDDAPGNFSQDERHDPAFAALVARTYEKNALSGVLRLRQDLGGESSVGLTATARDFVDDHNQVLGLDGRFRLDAKSYLSLQAVGTLARRFWSAPQGGPRPYEQRGGLGYSWRVDRTSRRAAFIANGEGRSPAYRAAAGFTQRTDTHFASLFARVGSEPRPAAALISWNVHQLSTANVNWDGRLQDWYERAGVTFNLRRQTAFTVDGSLLETRLFEAEFGRARGPGRPGAFFGAPERRGRGEALRVSLDSTPRAGFSLGAAWRLYRGEFDYDFGNGPRFPRVSPAALQDPAAPLDPGLGRGQDLDLYADLQPAAGLLVSLSFTRSLLRRDDSGLVALDQKIASLRLSYQFTRAAALRVRADFDTLDRSLRSQVLLAYTPSPGTAFYAGFDQLAAYDGWNPISGRYRPGFGLDARTFFVKASYLLRKQL